MHVSLNALPTHVQVAAVIKRCEAQSAAGKGRCSELERYMTNCIKVGCLIHQTERPWGAWDPLHVDLDSRLHPAMRSLLLLLLLLRTANSNGTCLKLGWRTARCRCTGRSVCGAPTLLSGRSAPSSPAARRCATPRRTPSSAAKSVSPASANCSLHGRQSALHSPSTAAYVESLSVSSQALLPSTAAALHGHLGVARMLSTSPAAVAGPGYQLGRSGKAQPCAAGSVKPVAGNSKCAKCSSGTYQPAAGARACLACPKGRVNGARTTCTSYPPGTQPGQDGSRKPCPAGQPHLFFAVRFAPAENRCSAVLSVFAPGSCSLTIIDDDWDVGTAKAGSGDFPCSLCTGTQHGGQRYSGRTGAKSCR
jgi:Tyrosine-protein kinase ephrin type A/B receptor-like